MIDKLYDYQAKAERDIRKSWREHRRVLLVLPTGAGKTVVAASIAARHKGSVLVLAHRRELVYQAQRRLVSAGAPASVQVMSVQAASHAIARGGELPPADLVVVDEAHHAPAKTWTRVLDRYPVARVLGLTATPYRADGAPLGSCFEVIVHGPTYEELFKAGRLAKPRVFSWPAPDLRDAKIERGDYAKGALKKFARKRLGDLVAHWLRYAEGLPTVVYAVDVEDAKAIVTRFNREGIRAAVLTGETPVFEREQLGRQLTSGQLKVVVNVEVLTEGWDMPEVRCAMLARPTRSKALHRQMCGRVMRAGTTPLILDHCGNVPLLDVPWSHVDVALDRRLPRTGKHGAVESQTRACPECGSAVSLGAQRCAYCDHVFWSKVPDEDASRWLVEVSGEDPRRARVIEMVRGGMTREEAAKLVGAHPAVVSRWCVGAGLRAREERPLIGPSVRERAIELVRSGKTRSEAAMAVGVRAPTVSAWCIAAGLRARATHRRCTTEEELERRREQKRVQGRARYYANLEKQREKTRAYRAANRAATREKARERARAYRARKKAQKAAEEQRWSNP